MLLKHKKKDVKFDTFQILLTFLKMKREYFEI